MDGFRALAHVSGDSTRLVSRRANTYKSFPRLCSAIHSAIACEAVLDGEIVCLDAHGRPQFYELLRRRGEPVFYAFDALWCDGEDLRGRPLVERKRVLRSIVPTPSTCLLYAEHVEPPAWSSSVGCVSRIWKASSQNSPVAPTASSGTRFGIWRIRSMKEGGNFSKNDLRRMFEPNLIYDPNPRIK